LAQSSQSFHEDPDKLSDDVKDRHRAIVSIMEELEAVDWYDQRVQGATDQELAAILAHNRDEEKEHAVMTLEWLRRRDPKLDEVLRTYLFSEGSILEVEEKLQAGDGGGGGGEQGGGPPPAAGSLGIGSLRGKK
jgi:ferritin-like protein